MTTAKKKPIATSNPKSSSERVRAYRERMQKKGMRLVQFWVPDTSTPEFKAEARRQPTEFASEPAIRTEDFRTKPTPEGRP